MLAALFDAQLLTQWGVGFFQSDQPSSFSCCWRKVQMGSCLMRSNFLHARTPARLTLIRRVQWVRVAILRARALATNDHAATMRENILQKCCSSYMLVGLYKPGHAVLMPLHFVTRLLVGLSGAVSLSHRSIYIFVFCVCLAILLRSYIRCVKEF